MPGSGHPRTITLTDRAWDALERIARPQHGTCPHCRHERYVWAGRVACVDSTTYRTCPGNGQPPARRSAPGGPA